MISTITTNKAAQNEPVIYMIGYEGLALETFVRRLNESGIKQILDVRRNPISRKPGFSKKKLAERLAVSGIQYFHFPELGIPTSMRRELNSKADYQRLLDEYEAKILLHPFILVFFSFSVKSKGTHLLFQCKFNPLSLVK